MFGRRKTPVQVTASLPRPPVDSDGRQRVFGEAIFAGKQGGFLRSLGLSPDDPSNIVPSEEDHERQIKWSLDRQEERRAALAEQLLREHGHDAIRPFLILSEAVYNGPLGPWLARVLKLLPYDDWNVVYLPVDEPTRAAMGTLPLHPRQSLEPIDELMSQRIGHFHARYMDGKRKVDAHVAAVGLVAAAPALGRFNDYVGRLSTELLDHVAEVRPMIVQLIANVQGRATR